MKNSYLKSTITYKEEIYPQIFKMKVKTSTKPEPGQFYMIKAWNSTSPFLSRPISVSDFDGSEITFLIEEKKIGTELITKLNLGDNMEILGPLGTGFDMVIDKKIALVSGGIGIAPLLYFVKKSKNTIDLYAGFRDYDYLIDEFSEYIDNVYIATDSGESGHCGVVTDLLNPEKYDLVIGCGPIGMIKTLSEICSGKVDLEISMEKSMACGIGACMGCNIDTKDGSKRVCKEGPVFINEELI